jgi:hypothetical protein
MAAWNIAWRVLHEHAIEFIKRRAPETKQNVPVQVDFTHEIVRCTRRLWNVIVFVQNGVLRVLEKYRCLFRELAMNALLLEIGERRHEYLDVGFRSFPGQSFIRSVSALAPKMVPPSYHRLPS